MVRVRGGRTARSVALQVAGWLLVVVGIAALVLPGPGLLALFAGLALLATQYEWARRRLEPVKEAALRAAGKSVASPAHIVGSAAGVAGLVALGVVWGLRPGAPAWWPIDDQWWMPGGWGAAVSLIVSGVIAGATLVYAYMNFREARQG